MNVIKRFHIHYNNETEKKFWVFLHCLNEPLKYEQFYCLSIVKLFFSSYKYQKNREKLNYREL